MPSQIFLENGLAVEVVQLAVVHAAGCGEKIGLAMERANRGKNVLNLQENFVLEDSFLQLKLGFQGDIGTLALDCELHHICPAADHAFREEMAVDQAFQILGCAEHVYEMLTIYIDCQIVLHNDLVLDNTFFSVRDSDDLKAFGYFHVLPSSPFL